MRGSKCGAALAVALLCARWGHAEVSAFDSASGSVFIPAVSVGPATYTQVRLQQQSDGSFTVGNALAADLSFPAAARFDTSSGVLRLPAVRVGDATYIDVELVDRGGLRFELASARLLPDAVADGALRYLAAIDEQWALAVPATGRALTSLLDACYRSDGRTAGWLAQEFDSDPAGVSGREQYQVGRSSGNVQVLELRERTNPDGSQRQEVDLEYDVFYADGSLQRAVPLTLISGSSAGTPGCAAPQQEAQWRAYGNQRLVQVAVIARNLRSEQHSMADGRARTPALSYSRNIHWLVSDPMATANYVVVSGPGPASVDGGKAVPFAAKLLSVRLLSTAPELVGKPGNSLNWRADDPWRICRSVLENTAPAHLADCAVTGTSTYEMGVTTVLPDAAADQRFDAQGWRAGGVYRFDVYADDGWKVVNGHAGRTPVATYYETLPLLPYTFQQMAPPGGADRFPQLTFVGMSEAEVAANAVSPTPRPMAVTWTPPAAVSDGRRFRLARAWEFHSGPSSANVGGATNPNYRSLLPVYPGGTATAIASWNLSTRLPLQARKVSVEFALQYVDRARAQIVWSYTIF